MQSQYFEVIYPSTWRVDEDIAVQLPARSEKAVQDARRCPCWRCEERGCCTRECRQFKQYCNTGKAR